MSFNKCIAVAAISTLFATSANAGGQAEPLMEPEVIAAETTDSGGFLIPLLMLAALVAIASTGGGGDVAPTKPVGK